jgi:DNA-binding FadR family transcriptional regulator
MSDDTRTDVRPAPLTLALVSINASASLRDQAYAKLKQAIADTDIYHSREEIRLDEKELTEALGVSRTPVREAMTLLEQEGLLRTVPAARNLYPAQDEERNRRHDLHVGGARKHGGPACDAARVR